VDVIPLRKGEEREGGDMEEDDVEREGEES